MINKAKIMQMIENYIVWLAVFLMLSAPILTPSPNRRAYSKVLCYCFEGYEWEAPMGVAGDIYTISLYVPLGEFVAEWVCIILDYSPLYWIQVGYTKEDNTIYFYAEKRDSEGWTYIPLSGTPKAGATYTYMIEWAYVWGEDPHRWYAKVIGVDGTYI